MTQDDPIEADLHSMMNAIAETLAIALPGMAFALLVFGDGNPQRANYISNADREDMVMALEEFVKRHKETIKNATH